MPPPPPPEETRWKPGQSGNPEGYSRGRRIQDRLVRIIEERGLEDAICMALIAKALGRKDLLKNPKTGEQREPALEWWDRLVGMVDGPVKDPSDVEATDTEQAPRIKLPDVDARHTPRIGDGPPEAGD